MYSQEKVNIALKLYQCRSVTKTVQTLGYPTRKALYDWVHDEGKPKNKERYLNSLILKLIHEIHPLK